MPDTRCCYVCVIIHEPFFNHEIPVSFLFRTNFAPCTFDIFSKIVLADLMGNCNPRALFVYACMSCLLAEACFLSVLLLEAKRKVDEGNITKTCWSSFASGKREDGVPDVVHCPYFALFLASIANGVLVCLTVLLLVARLLGSRECFLRRIPFIRVLFRYGPFFTNVLTTLLIGTFIGLLVGSKPNKKLTGDIFDRNCRLHFILIVAGFVSILIASVTSGLLAYQRRGRSINDDFEDTISHNFSDDYLDIN